MATLPVAHEEEPVRLLVPASQLHVQQDLAAVAVGVQLREQQRLRHRHVEPPTLLAVRQIHGGQPRRAGVLRRDPAVVRELAEQDQGVVGAVRDHGVELRLPLLFGGHGPIQLGELAPVVDGPGFAPLVPLAPPADHAVAAGRDHGLARRC